MTVEKISHISSKAMWLRWDSNLKPLDQQSDELLIVLFKEPVHTAEMLLMSAHNVSVEK